MHWKALSFSKENWCLAKRQESAELWSVNADVWGTIEGDICVKEKLEFKSVSNMKGNIKTSQLHIEAGAQFNGTCEMISDEFYAGYYNKLLEE